MPLPNSSKGKSSILPLLVRLVVLGALCVVVWRFYQVGTGRMNGGDSAALTTTKKKSSLPDGKAALVEGDRMPLPYHNDNWQPRKENRHWQAKRVPCGDAQADSFLTFGVDIVSGHVGGDSRYENVSHLPDSLLAFSKAVEIAPQCSAAQTSLIIMQFCLDHVTAAKQAADTAATHLPNDAKVLFWQGLINEFIDKESYSIMMRAFQIDQALSQEFFGIDVDVAKKQPNRVQFFHRSSSKLPAAVPTLRKMLLAREFGKWFGGFPALQMNEVKTWSTQWYFFVRNLLDPYTLDAVREFYRTSILDGSLRFKDRQAIRYISYNDPVARFTQSSHTDVFRRLSATAVKPTYTYFGGYVGSQGSDLKPHTDRPQCEFTCSLNLDVNPAAEVCPIALTPVVIPRAAAEQGGKNTLPPPHLRRYVYPRPGDALFFKGRHLVHWRDHIESHVNCSNVFLHYVHEDFVGTLD